MYTLSSAKVLSSLKQLAKTVHLTQTFAFLLDVISTPSAHMSYNLVFVCVKKVNKKTGIMEFKFSIQDSALFTLTVSLFCSF